MTFDKPCHRKNHLRFFENKIWMNTKEAADYLSINQGSLRNLTSEGKIPHYKLGRLNRYLKTDLDDLLLSQKRGGILWE